MLPRNVIVLPKSIRKCHSSVKCGPCYINIVGELSWFWQNRPWKVNVTSKSPIKRQCYVKISHETSMLRQNSPRIVTITSICPWKVVKILWKSPMKRHIRVKINHDTSTYVKIVHKCHNYVKIWHSSVKSVWITLLSELS